MPSALQAVTLGPLVTRVPCAPGTGSKIRSRLRALFNQSWAPLQTKSRVAVKFWSAHVAPMASYSRLQLHTMMHGLGQVVQAYTSRPYKFWLGAPISVLQQIMYPLTEPFLVDAWCITTTSPLHESYNIYVHMIYTPIGSLWDGIYWPWWGRGGGGSEQFIVVKALRYQKAK